MATVISTPIDRPFFGADNDLFHRCLVGPLSPAAVFP
jgi:hypothetical protein